jgi:RimJ/RimL family protein N-acetyltransferase
MQIESDRILMRSLQQLDAEELFSYRRDADVNRYQGWIPACPDDVEVFIRTRVSPEFDQPGTWHQLVLILKESGRIAGDIGIHFIDEDQVELGITLAQNFQGKGLATEALSAVIRLLFNDLKKHRIIASVDPRNDPSVRLIKRLGFRQEAHFRQSLKIGNEWIDDLVFALLAIER